MLLVKLWCVPRSPNELLSHLRREIFAIACKVRSSEVVDENDLLVIFPDAQCDTRPEGAIVVEISGARGAPPTRGCGATRTWRVAWPAHAPAAHRERRALCNRRCCRRRASAGPRRAYSGNPGADWNECRAQRQTRLDRASRFACGHDRGPESPPGSRRHCRRRGSILFPGCMDSRH